MLSRKIKILTAMVLSLFTFGIALAGPSSAAPSSVAASSVAAVDFTCHDGKTYTSNGFHYNVAGSGGKFIFRFGSNGGRTAVEVFVTEGNPAQLFLTDVGRGPAASIGIQGTGYSLCLVLRDNTAGPEIVVKRNGNVWRDFAPFP